MKKRKIVSLVLATALVGAIGIGSTLAYFTDNDAAENTITTGKVDIELAYDASSENIVPGDVITVNPVITVAEDSNDAYIRCKFVVTLADTNLSEASTTGSTYIDDIFYMLGTENAAQINEEDWYFDDKSEGLGVQADGTYVAYGYYQNVAKASEVISVFNNEGAFTVPTKWGNEWAEKSVAIDITAEAIQAANFEPENEEGVITGWGEVYDNVLVPAL